MPNSSFPIVTLAIWSEEQAPELVSQIVNKASEMEAEGKTDNVPEYDRQSPELDVRRNWIDTTAANEWVAFIQSIGGPLVSIVIE